MPYKVLIIDDDEEILAELKEMIKASGYNVVTTDNGLKAFELAKKERPDVIITDLNMEGVNGYQLALAFKSHHLTKYIPVIIMTGYLGDEESDKLKILLGNERFLRKPFSPCDVTNKLLDILSDKSR